MFIGDRLIRFDSRAPDEAIPDLATARAKYHDPAKQAHIQQAEKEDPVQWMAWSGKAYYAPKDAFSSLLDFMINLPPLQEAIQQNKGPEEWYWEEIKPGRLSQRFGDRSQKWLRGGLKMSDRVEKGWTLRKEYGRVDPDVTYAQFTYLLATLQYYVFFEEYEETLH